MSFLHSSLLQVRNLFWFSLILHLAIVFAVGNYHRPIVWENGSIAAHLYYGLGFVSGFSFPDEPTAWQAPGYPYLLALVWKLFGFQSASGYLLISLLQVIAVSSVVFPVVWLTRRWFDENTSIVAGIVTLLMPLLAWYATRIHHTAFVMAIHPWLVWGWVTAADRKSWQIAVLTGFLTGVAALFQPVLLPAFGAISAFLLVRSAILHDWNASACIIVGGCLTLLILVPWTIRNYEVFHQFVVVKDSFGKEFWAGNNPHATGTAYSEQGIDLGIAFPAKAYEFKGNMPEIYVMDALKKEALDYIAQEPGAFVKRTFKKLLWYWTITPANLERPTGGGEAIKFRGLQATYWFLYVVLMVIAAFRRPWPKEYIMIMVILSVVYSSVYSLTFVGQARFRGEIEYIFLPAVACGIMTLLPESWKLPRKESTA